MAPQIISNLIAKKLKFGLDDYNNNNNDDRGESFSYNSIDWKTLQYPHVPRGVTEMTLVFHGVNRLNEGTTMLMKCLSNMTPSSTSYPSYHYLMDWEYYSKQNMRIRAPFLGERIGKHVAIKHIPARIRRIHVIGISVGAHAADACVRQLKLERSDRIYIQETLISPVCARGWFDGRYGQREFGSRADYAQQFVSLENDEAGTRQHWSFGTSMPCYKCVVHDVTACRPTTVAAHEWPLLFYSKCLRNVGFVHDSIKQRRGVVIVIQ